jgi:hypothetical protein
MTISDALAVNDENWGLSGFDIARRKVMGTALEQSDAKTADGPSASEDLKGSQYYSGACISGLQSEKVRSHIQKTKNLAGNRGAAHDEEALTALATFTLEELPINFFYLGSVNALPLSTVLTCCPGIECYLINPWPPGQADGLECNPSTLSTLLERLQYRGYARCLFGPYETALQRLDASTNGSWKIELAYVDCDSISGALRASFEGIQERLAPGGIIIFSNIGASDIATLNEWADKKARGDRISFYESRRTAILSRKPRG